MCSKGFPLPKPGTRRNVGTDMKLDFLTDEEQNEKNEVRQVLDIRKR
jgi:hypothetical protein